MPPRVPRRRRRRRVDRGGAGPGVAARVSSSDCAPNEIRVTPARREGSRVAALVRPRVGLEGDLGVGGDPEALADAGEEPLDVVGRQERRRPAAEVDRCRAAGGPAPKARRGRRRAGRSRAGAPRGTRPIRDRGPRAAAPAKTTKSQYGQSETQNGIWTYSATGGGRRRRAPAHRSREADSRVPMTRQPSGGRRRLLDLLFLAAARLGLAGVPGAQEDREARDGVAQERGGDAAGRRGQPAADEARCRSSGRAGSGRGPGAPSRVVSAYSSVWMTFAAVGSSPVDSRSPKIAPRKVDLVDERRRRRVEQRPRIRPGVRQPDAVVAERGEGHGLADAERAVGEAAEDRAEPVARAEEELGRGDGWSTAAATAMAKPRPYHASAAPDPRPLPVAGRLVVLGRAEPLGVEPQHGEQHGQPDGDERRGAGR